MNHFTFSAVTTFISSLFVAIFFCTRRDNLLKLYGFYWAVISFWSFTVGFQSHLLKYMPDVVWGWLLHLGCLFIPTIFLHFSVKFSGINRELGKKIIVTAYLVTSLYLILNSFTPYFTKGTSYRDNYAYPTPSNFYIIYFITFVSMIICGTCCLVYRHRNEQILSNRRWLTIFILVHLIAYLGAMDNFFIMADIRIFPWYPFGLYPVFLYAVVGWVALNQMLAKQLNR